MPKGFFAQGLAVLFEQPVSLDVIAEALSSFNIRARVDNPGENWPFGGPSLTVAYRPEVNGYIVVDVVTRQWPDEMGDSEKEPLLFGAWAMGHFGPFTYPGSLERAQQQSWSWEEAATMVGRHKTFVRVRLSYVLGSGEEAPIMPTDFDSVHELLFLTAIASSLLNIPGALGYFNPNGEVLRDKAALEKSVAFAEEAKLPPLELWSNIRLFKLDETWSLMDTIGNLQFDVGDVEAGFVRANYDCGEVDNFLRELSWYMSRSGASFNDRDTVDGPGQTVWVASRTVSLTDPPRETFRFLPVDAEQPPALLVAAAREGSAK